MSKIKVILIKIDGKVEQIILNSERPLYHPILAKNRFGESNFGDYDRDETLSFMAEIKLEDIHRSLLIMMFPYGKEDESKIYRCSSCNKEISFADWYECSICVDCLCKSLPVGGLL